ncbi:hypothetical protein M2145_001737 [Lachnospiraceae bacterium PF1-21]
MKVCVRLLHPAINIRYEYRVAPGTAITNNRDNDTPVQSQFVRAAVITVSRPKQ